MSFAQKIKAKIEAAVKKHGVILEKTAKGKTNKVIYNAGFKMNTYKNVPLSIKFKSPMVNDENQHLCGSWSMKEHRGLNEEYEVKRVIDKLKPLAVIWVDKEDVSHFKTLADLHHLLFSVVKSKHKDFTVTISQKGKLKDLFDMDTLADDYDTVISKEFGVTIRKYKSVDMKQFHNGHFDTDFNPIEITGLILGYPIENTMSLIMHK